MTLMELWPSSYIVALRRREIGVRLAIGAPPSRIITLVIRQALKLVLAGMACGLALAVPMAFAMRATFVAKVNASDPMVFLPKSTWVDAQRRRGQSRRRGDHDVSYGGFSS